MSNDKPRMNDSIRLAIFSIAILAFGCTRAPVRDPNVFTFTFAPPDGTRLVETITSTRKLFGNGRLRRTDLGQTQAETVLERRGDEGFVITSKLLSMELIRDGNEVRDPVSQVLVDAVITARLDMTGQVIAWSGFEEVAESLFARLPAKVVRAIEPIAGAEALEARATAEWSGRISDFVGRSGAIGEGLWSRSTYTLPDGTAIDFDVHTYYAELLPCPAGTCVRIEQQYDSDASALFARIAEALGEVVAAVGAPDADLTAGEAHIRGTISRVVDPATLLFYAETITRRVDAILDLGGGAGPEPLTIDEKRQYDFRYLAE